MTMDSELITTSINWTVNNQKSIEDAVKVTHSLVNNSDDIEETVSVESCIHLRAPPCTDGNGDDKCTLKLECCKPETNGLSQLIVVSEAKKLEIYTDHGEYLQTVSTDFIDKIDEDFIVYKGTFDFEKPVSSCVVKFASLRKPHELWVYGVRLTVVNVDKLPSLNMKKPVFDMDKVLQRIQGSDHQLSGKAQNFAKFLSMCKKSETEGPNYSEILSLCSTFLRPPGENSLKVEGGTITKGQGLPGDLQSNHLLQKYLEQLQKGPAPSGVGIGALKLPRSFDEAGGSGEGNLEHKMKAGVASQGVDFLEPFRKSILQDVDELFSRHMQQLEERLWSKLSLKFSELESKQAQQLKQLQETLETCLKNKNTTESDGMRSEKDS